MLGGSVFTHIEKDKFLVTNTGDGKDINNTVVKLVLKDLKEILSSYGVDTKKKKKQELLDDFIKLSKNMTIEPKPVPPKKTRTKAVKTRTKAVKKEPVKFEPLEEAMMDTTPKSKNIQIKKPFRLSPELEKASDPNRLAQLLPIRSEREDELLEMEEDELNDIISDKEIILKKKDKRSMIDAILKKEKIVKGTVLPEDVYNDLVEQHNILSLKNSRGERSLYVMYRTLENMKTKLAQKRKKPESARDTSEEMFDDLKIKRFEQRINDVEEILLKTITKGKKGGSISAKDLKGLHASSYKEVPDKEVNGWVLDEDISKPTARVYFNASKNQAIVVHRGTEATVKDWANNLAYITGTNKLTGRYKDAERVQKRAEEKYPDLLTTGHSQGGIYTKIAKDQSKVINVNPASMGETTSGTTIRSKNDPVSALAGLTGLFKKNDKNITTSAQANPLAAHSIDILDELGDKELGGSLTKYLKMLGKKGKKGNGAFEDFFKKTLPRALVKQGIPIVGSVAGTALGSIAGPISGAVGAEVGSKAGELLSNYVSEKAGLGVKQRPAWIKHIKAYQAKHGCSYKDAMKGASKELKGGVIHSYVRRRQLRGKDMVSPELASTLGELTEEEKDQYIALDKEQNALAIARMKDEIGMWKRELERNPPNESRKVYETFIRELKEDIDKERIRHEILKQTVRSDLPIDSDKEVIRAEARYGVHSYVPTTTANEIQESTRIPRGSKTVTKGYEFGRTPENIRRSALRNFKGVNIQDRLDDDTLSIVRDYLAPAPEPTRIVPVETQREYNQAELIEGGGISKRNKWIAHVKEYAKKHGVTYAHAMKEAKATYKK